MTETGLTQGATMATKHFLYQLELPTDKPTAFGDLPHLIAQALNPDDPEGLGYGCTRINLEEELKAAVKNGELMVRDPLTLGPHTFPAGQALQSAVVLPGDIEPFLAARSIRLVPGLTAAYESQEQAKRNAGRYTIREAAELLQQYAGERADSMIEKLSKAASAGVLPMYCPGENARLDYDGFDWRQCVRDFYEEAYWDGLNAWLDANEPRIAWRFPSPAGNTVCEAQFSASSKEGPKGLGRQDILSADWPLFGRFNQKSLGTALSDVPKWLLDARVSQGAPGKSSALWNPALIAVCLVGRGHSRKSALTPFLRNNFGGWLAEWEEVSADL
jgi:hypothetical protein